MSPADRFVRFQRILVAVDNSSNSLAALDQAAVLAELLHCELSGMFVEDSDVLNLAALPFTKAIAPLGGQERALNRVGVEQQLRLRAAAARRAVEHTAGRRHISWQFAVKRGSVEDELIAAATTTDLLCVGKTRPAEQIRSRLGSRARGVARHPAVLFVGQGEAGRNGPIVMRHDGSDHAGHGLALARRLASATGRLLTILLTPAAMPLQPALLAEAGEDAEFLALGNDPNALTETVLDIAPSLLVLCATGDAEADRQLDQATAAIKSPVLLLRPQPGEGPVD